MGWSDWLGVAGFFVGVVAILMAVQPLAQAFWGRPSLEAVKSQRSVETLRVLEYVIFNKPVPRLLKKIGVTRSTAEAVMAPFRILDVSDTEVFSAVPKINTFGTQAQSARIPEGMPGGTFGVATISSTGQVRPGLDVKEASPLPIGDYRVLIQVGIGSSKVVFESKFKVLRDPPYAHWVSS